MQTIISYNEKEVKEQKEFQNINSKDKAWIDLIDPSDETIKKIASYFHLDQSAVDLCRSKSKKPQIRLLDNHTFTIFLDIKFKNSQTVVTEGVYLFCGKNWLITIHAAEVDLAISIRKLLVNFLSHMEKDQGEVKYIQMAYDNISQLVDLVESYRDTINSVRDLYIANISLEMNDTMRTLTIFASVLLPLTLVASIYGMNGLDLNSIATIPSGLITVLISMAAILGGMFYLFSRKKWIIFKRKKVLPKDASKR